MMPARLDLDFRRRRRVSGFGVAILAAAAVSFGSAVAAQWSAEAQIERLERQLVGLAPSPHAERQTERLPAATAEHMRAVVARLNLPWEGFFAALEAVVADDVTLLSIAPNAGRGTLQLQGEARDLYAALRYVKALEDAGYFSQVELAEHEVGKATPALPVRFAIAARWGGGGR